MALSGTVNSVDTTKTGYTYSISKFYSCLALAAKCGVDRKPLCSPPAQSLHLNGTIPVMSPASPATATATLPAGLQWDVFCRVIDNHGDLGVAWRLCSQLAQRGQRVRLWVDDPSALGWMAPGAVQGQVPGVRIIPWRQTTGDDGNEMTAQPEGITRSDIWVETFGCDIDPHFIATQRHFTLDSIQKGIKNPVWINLEYLSAEPYVER